MKDKAIVKVIDKLNKPMVKKLEAFILTPLRNTILIPDICQIIVSYATYEKECEGEQHLCYPIESVRYYYAIFGKKVGHTASWYTNAIRKNELLSVGVFNNGVKSGAWKERDYTPSIWGNRWCTGNYSKTQERTGIWKMFNYQEKLSIDDIVSNKIKAGSVNRNYTKEK